MNLSARKNLIVFGLAAALGVVVMAPARAHHFIPQQALDCSENFPCRADLQPRVRFWIEVFRTWGKKTAILHDPDRPERVYAVFNSGRGCNRAARSILKRKRAQVEKSLRAVATKLESGRELSGDHERHLAAMFPAGNPKEIRAAAKNIRCQSGVRDSFIGGLKRYHRYRDMIDNVLAESGLPEEIRYLPFVESSYNPAAYSKAGAAGMWQIMPKTGRVLGLELNATLDERLDPEAATRAAAEYLKRADKTLTAVAREANPAITRAQINPFIITSYNYGVAGMTRAIRQVEPDFMEVLERHKSPSFQIAVKNFYASFLAARHVAINADRYFGALAKSDREQYQTVVLAHPTSMARIEQVFGLRESQLRPLNRALTRFVWRGWRLIPAGYRLRLPPKSDRWQAERTRLASLSPEKVLSGGDRYTVRRGDTACGIARAVKVNCSELIRANQLGRKALIRVNQKLVIPRKLQVAATPSGGGTTYRVRPGDSACRIAARFGVGCRTLISHNRLGRTAKIYAGQALLIPDEAPASSQPTGLTADQQYIVRKGDSACLVARRFAVRCAALRQLNRLDRKATIYLGQKLKIPGLVLPETNRTAQQLAQVEVTTPPAEVAAVDVVDADVVEPDVVDADVVAPAVVTSEADAQDQAARTDETDFEAGGQSTPEVAAVGVVRDANALLNLLDTLPDLGIKVTSVAGKPVYAVRVEADETLGHFADWLGIGRVSTLRDMNGLRGRRTIAIGRRLVLPVKDAKMVERFEQRRSEYHQVLSEQLKEHYNLVGSESYTVKKGDSPWSLSTRRGFPVWLLYRLNPSLRDAQLKPGQRLALPKLTAKA